MKDVRQGTMRPEGAIDPDASSAGKTIDRMLDPKHTDLRDGRRQYPKKIGRHGTDKEKDLNPEE